jgi:hypothetical protein
MEWRVNFVMLKEDSMLKLEAILKYTQYTE